MNELVKFAGGIPVNPEDLEKGLQNVQSSIQGGAGGIPFLRLLKAGYFVYGQENIEVEPGSEWAINPYSLMHGFACWGTGELLEERMVPFTQPPPNKSELPDLGQDWAQQVAMHLQCVSGEDTGLGVLYKGTSTGLRNASKQLISEMLAQLQTDKVHIVPVVELEVDSYQHKDYGQIFIPILTVKSWTSMEGAEATSGQVTDESEAAPDSDGEATEAKNATPARRRRGGAKTTTKADGNGETAPPKSSNRRRRARGS